MTNLQVRLRFLLIYLEGGMRKAKAVGLPGDRLRSPITDSEREVDTMEKENKAVSHFESPLGMEVEYK